MKVKKLLVLFFVIAVSAGAFYAAKKIYSHEHELNSRLALIENSISRISDSLKKEELPLKKSNSEDLYQSLTSNIASFQDNFDAYMAMACGRNINILVVGDSISALDWPQQLAEWISYNYGIQCVVKNISMGGNSSYAGYVRTNILNDPFDYDLVILCFGQNDEEENFSLYYESVIRSLLKKGKSTIISVLESSQRGYTEKISEIMELADYYGIAVADTIHAFETSELSYESLAPDGVHPGEKGQEIYLNVFTDLIEKKVSEAVNDIADYYLEGNALHPDKNMSRIKPPVNEGVLSFDKGTYYPSNVFKRIDDRTFQMEIENFEGIPGIYMTRFPGENDVVIKVNGEVICEYNEEFLHSFSQEIVHAFKSIYLKADGVLSVAFANKEQADGFFGIMICNKC